MPEWYHYSEKSSNEESTVSCKIATIIYVFEKRQSWTGVVLVSISHFSQFLTNLSAHSPAALVSISDFPRFLTNLSAHSPAALVSVSHFSRFLTNLSAHSPTALVSVSHFSRFLTNGSVDSPAILVSVSRFPQFLTISLRARAPTIHVSSNFIILFYAFPSLYTKEIAALLQGLPFL